MATTSFQFKLDPASLPKLGSRGENFPEYRSAWTIAFRYAGLWPIISKKKTRPTPLTAGTGVTDAAVVTRETAIDDWDKKDTQALVMILSSVHNDLTQQVADCETSAAAWDYLSSRFDRDTGQSSILLFRSLTNLRYRDGDDLRLHLDEFHQRWTRLSKRCASSTQPVATAMRTMFTDDNVKGSFFLATLPDTMDHIIDNLSTQQLTAFKDIEPKILDVSEKHSLDTVDSTAYAARQTAARAARGTKPTGNSECTWCRKHNLTFIGHVYTNCNELRKHKEQQQSKTASKTAGKTADKGKGQGQTKRQKGNSAEVIESSDTEGDATDVNAFSATVQYIDLTTPPPSPRINSNGKRARSDDVSAHAASISQPSSTPAAWLFDTGASRHMTGCIDDFATLSPGRGTITIAGGIKLPIHGVGTVRLRCRLPDGSTAISELTNTLYSSELRQTRLFSWAYVRQRYELSAIKNDLYLTRKGKQVLWARHTDGVIQIQTEDSPTKPATAGLSAHPTESPLAISVSKSAFQTASETGDSFTKDLDSAACFATFEEFHHAIGHRRIDNPQRLYRDGHLVPVAPDGFQCETCVVSKSKHHRPKHDPTARHQPTKPLEVIHSDLSGKFSRKSLGGKRYYISFVDDCTRHS